MRGSRRDGPPLTLTEYKKPLRISPKGLSIFSCSISRLAVSLRKTVVGEAGMLEVAEVPPFYTFLRAMAFTSAAEPAVRVVPLSQVQVDPIFVWTVDRG